MLQYRYPLMLSVDRGFIHHAAFNSPTSPRIIGSHRQPSLKVYDH